LLEPGDLAGLEVTWLAADEPTPSGPWVALVPLLSRWVGGSEFRRLPKLRIVANVAVGFNNIDVVAAELRRVIVTNTPDVLTEATADLTWALILACARRLLAGVELVKSGQWTGWHPTQLLGMELKEKTLGLLGAGRIGQAVARRATAFGMRLLYVARAVKPQLEAATGARRVELGPLFRESDVLSLHVPAVPELKGIVSAENLAQMKPGAILVNTSRGDLVREEALASALEQGHLGAAGLDVYTDEPQISARLLTAPRTVLLPHIGSATLETRRAMARLALANVQAVLAGRAPLTAVFG
jgi:glyoxylate reductase